MGYAPKFGPHSPSECSIIYGLSLHTSLRSAQSPRWARMAQCRRVAAPRRPNMLYKMGCGDHACKWLQLKPIASEPVPSGEFNRLKSKAWIDFNISWKVPFLQMLLHGGPISDQALFFFAITLHEQTFMLIHDHHKIASEICLRKMYDFTQKPVF